MNAKWSENASKVLLLALTDSVLAKATRTFPFILTVTLLTECKFLTLSQSREEKDHSILKLKLREEKPNISEVVNSQWPVVTIQEHNG